MVKKSVSFVLTLMVAILIFSIQHAAAMEARELVNRLNEMRDQHASGIIESSEYKRSVRQLVDAYLKMDEISGKEVVDVESMPVSGHSRGICVINGSPHVFKKVSITIKKGAKMFEVIDSLGRINIGEKACSTKAGLVSFDESEPYCWPFYIGPFPDGTTVRFEKGLEEEGWLYYSVFDRNGKLVKRFKMKCKKRN